VLVGSSNIYGYYNNDAFKDYNKYMLLKCTDIKSFEAIMANFGIKDKEVIVLVLVNFLNRCETEEDLDQEDCDVHLCDLVSRLWGSDPLHQPC
jgi:hypothetical protein